MQNRARTFLFAEGIYGGCVFCSPPALSIFVPKAYSGYIRGSSVPKQQSGPAVDLADDRKEFQTHTKSSVELEPKRFGVSISSSRRTILLRNGKLEIHFKNTYI